MKNPIKYAVAFLIFCLALLIPYGIWRDWQKTKQKQDFDAEMRRYSQMIDSTSTWTVQTPTPTPTAEVSRGIKWTKRPTITINTPTDYPDPSDYDPPSYSSSGGSSGGTVNVRGYYRKNGTYVRPHTRRAPRR